MAAVCIERIRSCPKAGAASKTSAARSAGRREVTMEGSGRVESVAGRLSRDGVKGGSRSYQIDVKARTAKDGARVANLLAPVATRALLIASLFHSLARVDD